ncbi:MAG: SAM-dependent chlorinase/fluorinase [Solirubrobacterales bacterium]|nr:SAM-dependent chlorinase/fluorinase [Solirubrobacterales bacterium]
MTVLTLVALILAVAAARELIAARGERTRRVLGRRLRALGDGDRFGPAAWLEAADRRLRDAGLRGRFAAGELVAAKLGAAVVSAPLAKTAAAAAPGRLGWIVVAAVPAAAFLLPDLVVAAAARRRRARIAAGLPDSLDLMATGAAGGRGVVTLLEEAMRSSAGPLREELAAAGEPIEPSSLERQPVSRPRLEQLRAFAHAERIDGFGNISLDLCQDDLDGHPLAGATRVSVGSRKRRRTATRANAFEDVADGGFLFYEDSSGRMAIAVNRGDASEVLDLRVGDVVELEPAP